MAEVHARTAVAVVHVSPTKPKGKGRLEATETRDSVSRMNSVMCLVQRVHASGKKAYENPQNFPRAQLNGLTRNEGSTKWKGA